MIVKAPLRLSIGGGGSDLPAYADKYGGFWVSAAINKYVYVDKTDEIKTRSDILPRTGMGSSSALFVALTKAFNPDIIGDALAETAFKIESELSPVGRQDHYASALGGIRAYTFRDGYITSEPLVFDYDMFLSRLSLWSMGDQRDANDILGEQQKNINKNVDTMHRIKMIGYRIYCSLINNDFDTVGDMFHEHWMLKKKISSRMSNRYIDAFYDEARCQGASGGKVVGAGGGGFLLFYSNKPINLPLDRINFKFDFTGCSISENI